MVQFLDEALQLPLLEHPALTRRLFLRLLDSPWLVPRLGPGVIIIAHLCCYSLQKNGRLQAKNRRSHCGDGYRFNWACVSGARL
jgi:hypothetical protein